MTARSSPQHAATVRAQVKRRGDVHWKRAQLLVAAAKHQRQLDRETALFGGPVDWAAMFYGLSGYSADAAANRFPHGLSALVDEPKTEEQKASRWARIWGRRE